MYYREIDTKNQRFVIEDRDGNEIAGIDMPNQSLQHLPKIKQVSDPENKKTWRAVYALVMAANKGLG